MLILKCVELYLNWPIHLVVWCLINYRHNVTLAWVVCKSRSPLCSPSVARTRKSWERDCPGFWSFWMLASYLSGSSVWNVLHITLLAPSVLRWQLPERLFTAGLSASDCISNPHLDFLYTATFNRTWTVPLLTCHGEERVLCYLLRRTRGLQIVRLCVQKDGRRVPSLYRTQLWGFRFEQYTLYNVIQRDRTSLR